jgi:RNA polymerase sigma-70 factor (ECF subfamily)
MAGGDEALSSGDGSASEETARRLDVERALQDLSADHREVVVLREFQGMSYAEMAEVLNVPQGTVESRLYRARLSLQHALREYLP